MQCLGGSPGHCTSQHRLAPALHMVSFENFVKSLPPSLSELKVKPIFCFPIKIRDDRAASSNYIVPNINNSRHSRGKWYRWLCLIFLQLPSRRWRLRCTEVLDDVALCTSLANRARHIVGIWSILSQTGLFVCLNGHLERWLRHLRLIYYDNCNVSV